jgi:glutamine synthetase
MTKAPKSVSDAMKYLKDKDVKYVDLRFTDPRGKMQHVTHKDMSCVDETFSPTA